MSCNRASVVHQAHGTATSAHPGSTVQALPSPHLLRAARHLMVMGGRTLLHFAKGCNVVWLLHCMVPPTVD